ncbi:hypothetical protein HGRIS_002923 [Hohenbuehelia grisea]|uniref:SET domain-containing protein n=1 Tax=Hohenbuehelia grisea TaxID=104357 RepID=A0ABR3JLX9_9AGAR
MMWEEANAGKWAAYLASLPSKFDTPMFWNEQDLAELKGTSVVEKLGKEDAERDYREKLLPVISSRKDLFPPHLIPFHYTLERYHIHGSRILSRSFCVEPAPSDASDEPSGTTQNHDDAMDVDVPSDSQSHPAATRVHDNDGDLSVDQDDEDEEEEDIVSMVPMADMLNARYGSENAKLFYGANELRMVTTKPIKAGEQIFNTYNDLPNAELLRRYGHVDYLSLPASLTQGSPNGSAALGNPGDVVELRADLVLTAANDRIYSTAAPPAQNVSAIAAESQRRIDWWLEMGGDDVFVLEPPSESLLPEDLVSLVRLLCDDDEWRKAQDKEKPPKAKKDKVVLEVTKQALLKRQALYEGSLEDDEALMNLSSDLPLNKKHATIVRAGEKRILRAILHQLELTIEALSQKGGMSNGEGSSRGKRKGMDDDDNGGKKARR